LIPVLAPIIGRFCLGPVALGDFWSARLSPEFFVAISLTSGGGAWDNAKKIIEAALRRARARFAQSGGGNRRHGRRPVQDTAGPADKIR